jgi:hypothetical protein
VLAGVAIVLTMVILIGQMVGRPDPPPSRAAPPATGPPVTSSGAGQRPGRFTATGPGVQGIALPGLGRCVPGRTYAATLLVRASRPGTLLMVTLLEVAGGRQVAGDTVGAVLEDPNWRRIEVAHEAHLPGTALALRVVLPRGSPRATVLVGDLTVGAERP